MSLRRVLPLLLVPLVLGLVRLARAEVPGSAPRPNIVYILADDLGWKDVGYHGSEIRTPNIDRIAATGVKLEQFHVMPVCSPTRACLMTGRYPIRYGLQSGVVRPWATYGLPLEEHTLAQGLREAGYETAIAGKWHLGDFQRAYLPTQRGFEHQYGQFTGAIDYFDHTRLGGFDWHRDDKACHDEGYTTDLLGAEAVQRIEKRDRNRPLFLYVPFNAPHAPLQSPQKYLDMYAGIADMKRRRYAAMVTCEDEWIGRIAAALDKAGIRENTLLLFSSDNGGPLNEGANNGTLRAGKGTLYEGGVRVPAFAVWPGKLQPGTTNAELLHMVDWYPTLLNLAGAKAEQKLPLDGLDIWPTLSQGKPTPHKKLLVDAEPQRGAVRAGKWKLLVHGKLPHAQDAPGTVELFDMDADPSETTNLAEQESGRLIELMGALNSYALAAVPPRGGGPADRMPADWHAPAVYGEPGRTTKLLYPRNAQALEGEE